MSGICGLERVRDVSEVMCDEGFGNPFHQGCIDLEGKKTGSSGWKCKLCRIQLPKKP